MALVWIFIAVARAHEHTKQERLIIKIIGNPGRVIVARAGVIDLPL